MDNNLFFGNDFRVLAPRVFVKIYRLHKTFDSISDGRIFEPKSFNFSPRDKINNDAQKRIKGIKHETTALFGETCEINIGDDLGGKYLNDVQEGDYIEVYYVDTKQETSDLIQKIFDFSSYTSYRSSEIENLNPKFTGHVWKVEEIQKPSQITLTVYAWDYHRLLQYVNIPRGQRTTRFSYRKLIVDSDSKKFRTNIIQGDLHFQNDFLDYVDGVFQIMLRNISTSNKGFVFRKPVVTYKLDENKVNVSLNIPNIQLCGIGSAIKVDDFEREYGTSAINALTNLNSFKQFTSENIGLEIDKKIAEFYSSDTEVDSAVFRFMDATIKIDGNASQSSISYHFVGDIVTINQFYLSQLLVSGVTYEQGINEWYTPIVDIDANYRDKIRDLHKQFPFKTAQNDTLRMRNGLLTYVSFRIQVLGAENTIQNQEEFPSFSKLVSFNIDSFSEIIEFFSKANEISLSAVADSIYGSNSSIDNSDLRYNPNLLSIALSIVNFPQIKKEYEYITQIDDLMLTENQNNVLRRLQQVYDLEGSNAFLVYYQMINKFSVNVQRYSDLMMTAFRTDSHFIQYVSSIPGNYMRADIYTGSKFKTLGYDSISIVRMVQILTSSMVGFPPTNNPIFSGGDASSTKEYFPMSITNRVLVESMTVMTTKVDNAVGKYEGYTRLDKLSEGSEFFQFQILKIGFRDTLSSSEEAEFNIPITHVNDIGIVKGSAINKIFKFNVDLGNNDKFSNIRSALESNSTREDKVTITVLGNNDIQQQREANLLSEIPNVPLIIAYKMGSDKKVSDMTVSAPEFETLSLNDLTKSEVYDSLFNRVRHFYNVSVNSASQLPTSNPHLSGIIHLLGNIMEQTTITTEPNIDKSYIFSPIIPSARSETYMSRSFALDYSDTQSINTDNYNALKGFQRHLVSVTQYCDISDIIIELQNMYQMAVNKEVLNKDISNASNSKTLMENIIIRTPYIPVIIEDKVQSLSDRVSGTASQFTVKRLSVVNTEDVLGDAEVTMYTYIKTLKDQGLFDMTQQDMVWTLPLQGHIIQALDTNNFTFKLPKVNFTIGGFVIDVVQARSYSAVIILDTLVKGMRYIMWSLNKSRFVNHIYSPIDYKKYQVNVKSTEDPIIKPGSSVIVSKPKEFDLNEQSSAGISSRASLLIDSFDKVKGIFGNGKLFRDRLGKENILEVFSDENGKYGMIWYVSKKVVYIGEDVGAMMSLLCTEGSFNWTVFYREDTQLTEVAEYFLKQGLGSFFLRGE